jgi:hypothetical protein
MLSIKGRVTRPAAGTAARWRAALENDVLPAIPLVQPLRTAAEREAAYARRGDLVLNTNFGAERDQAVRAAATRLESR